jgi:hypothetical protein
MIDPSSQLAAKPHRYFIYHSLHYHCITTFRPRLHSPSKRNKHRHNRNHLLPPSAALYTLPDALSDSLKTGATLGIALSLALSALPILTGESKERNEARYNRPSQDEGVENIRWSVMAVLSFLPFIHPLSWIFAALDSDNASSSSTTTTTTLYFSFALLYSLPYLANGIEFDSAAALALVVGVAHVQLERIAQTEPVEAQLPTLLKSILKSIPRLFSVVARYGVSLGDEVVERTAREKDRGGGGVEKERGMLEERGAGEERMRLDKEEKTFEEEEGEKEEEERDRSR